jgi:hypothetical protein
MEDNLEIYRKINEKINMKLENSAEEKNRILIEMQHENTLVATLRMHLYAEKELDEIIESIFRYPKSIKEQGFKSKLNLLYNLGVIDKSLFDAVSKLNGVRNGYAHDLEYGKTENVYSNLKSGLSANILKNHEINVKMIELLNGVINNEAKIRILLSGIWIQFKILSTSMILKKFELAKRLREEVIEDLQNN